MSNFNYALRRGTVEKTLNKILGVSPELQVQGFINNNQRKSPDSKIINRKRIAIPRDYKSPFGQRETLRHNSYSSSSIWYEFRQLW